MTILLNLDSPTDESFVMQIAFTNVTGTGSLSKPYRIESANDIISNVCFVAGTDVTTDQGVIEINKLIPYYHTINGTNILCITKTKTDESILVCFKRGSLGKNIPSCDVITSQRHSLIYDGVFIEARFFIGCPNIVTIPYNGESLFNIVLEESGTVQIANMLWDTLPKHCLVAKYFINKDHDTLYTSHNAKLFV